MQRRKPSVIISFSKYTRLKSGVKAFPPIIVPFPDKIFDR